MDGIILINKEKEWTSHDVVAKVKKMLNVKVGHTGTLDPNATGVLPLLLGDATKISKYLINHDKEYVAELKLGIKTDTADGEGNIIEEKYVNLQEKFLEGKKLSKTDEESLKNSLIKSEKEMPSKSWTKRGWAMSNKSLTNNKETTSNENKKIKEELQKILNTFIGKSLQTPPMYSAIKVNGKKLYEYARENKEVNIKPREIEIYNIKLLNIDLKENIITFKVSCSKGTYIRTLCENIAEKLDTCGYMKELQRTQVGDFRIEDSITINELEEKIRSKEILNNLNSNDDRSNCFITIEQLFSNCNEIRLNAEQVNKFLNGVKINNSKLDGIYRIYSENNFIGLGINKEKKLKRDVII